jgi:hypothetical protein
MSTSIKLAPVTVDCPNAAGLAEFYASITDGTVTFADGGWAEVDRPNGCIDFQTAPGHIQPAWPDPASSMQIHLDFIVDDLDAAEALVVAAGATKYDFQPNAHCRVYADPAGHPFCLSIANSQGGDAID